MAEPVTIEARANGSVRRRRLSSQARGRLIGVNEVMLWFQLLGQMTLSYAEGIAGLSHLYILTNRHPSVDPALSK
ncbi:hypothetical protein GBS0709_00580 [Edwardsiella tarda]|nr:hypothetical protein GBS0709_00580 [Edwardsiella tarda]